LFPYFFSGYFPPKIHYGERCSAKPTTAIVLRPNTLQRAKLAFVPTAVFDRRSSLRRAKAVTEGFEPSVQFPVRQFSKLILSASQAPHHIAVIKDLYLNKPIFSGLQI
jgi:hypothetical protein